MFGRCFKICFLLLLLATSVWAKQVPPRPENSYVYDEDRVLRSEETRLFNELAEELYRKTGVGLACAIVKSLEGEDARDFAFRIADSWKIGKKGKDGILIFASLLERKRSVEVGYALEPILPDALVERFQQKTLVPLFREEKYGMGVLLLAEQIATTIAKEEKVSLNVTLKREFPEESRGTPMPFLIFFILLLLLCSSKFGRAMLYMLFLSSLSGSSSRRSHMGGGFGGGFGGGRFGGGGSGGSW